MRMLSRVLIGVAACATFGSAALRAETVPCINIYHDDAPTSPDGPIDAVMLANLLGHWPNYEIRARPITAYESRDLEACKATIYLGTETDAEIPEAFLSDYFTTQKRVAWIGFGQQQLSRKEFAETFKHVVMGQLEADTSNPMKPRFFQHVSYKERLFEKSVDFVDGKPEGAFEAVRFVPTEELSNNYVAANLVHNTTFKTSAYFLRSGSKFVVGDIPFSYMHEGDRYFAFADFLFDILDEQPVRQSAIAFARTEDIHGFYETNLLDAALAAHQSEGVPFSIAHIPLFADPFNTFGAGEMKTPVAASERPEFMSLVRKIQADPRNAIIWHGVTHQFGERKNPHTGTSGDDYEFWDMVANRPVPGDSVEGTLDRLAKALPVFSAYGMEPRYWVTPHYHASAMDSRVFAEIFPWSVGRVTYYGSSFGSTFTIPAASSSSWSSLPSITPELLEGKKRVALSGLDKRSEAGLTQMFPFEIYRDVYGQRIIPETLGYLSYETSDQTAFVRTVDDMLADARRNSVVRDYWASFFYHPYIFSSKESGGVGRFSGDTLELRKLLIGLKMLGYTFTSLGEFDSSIKLVGKLGDATKNPPLQR